MNEEWITVGQRYRVLLCSVMLPVSCQIFFFFTWLGLFEHRHHMSQKVGQLLSAFGVLVLWWNVFMTPQRSIHSVIQQQDTSHSQYTIWHFVIHWHWTWKPSVMSRYLCVVAWCAYIPWWIRCSFPAFLWCKWMSQIWILWIQSQWFVPHSPIRIYLKSICSMHTNPLGGSISQVIWKEKRVNQ